MVRLVQLKLFTRLVVLTLLIGCLFITYRDSGRAQRESTPMRPAITEQPPPPAIVIPPQSGSPITISAARAGVSDLETTDIEFTITNVSQKVITAFAYYQDVEAAGEKHQTSALQYLQLTDSQLAPNQSVTDYSAYQNLASEKHEVTLQIDYVQFADGTTWGADFSKSGEVIAGERAAATILTKRLVKILNTDNAGQVMSAIEAGAGNIEPPSTRPDQWQEGFRLACNTLVRRIKEAESKGGWPRVQAELHRLDNAFKEDPQ